MAALVVFFYHCVLLFALCPPLLARIVKTPVGLAIYGGHQAVILFFVLSGFVLYLPYTQPGYRPSWTAFILKRICRIYLPYLGALLFSILAYLGFFKFPRPTGLSQLYGWRVLTLSQGIPILLNHILLVGFYDRDYFNGATWTLAEELRISLVFPALALMVLRLRSSTSLLLALGCSFVVSIAVQISHHRSPFCTFHYASLFVLGAVLASKRAALIERWRKAGGGLQSLTTAAAIFCASYALFLMTRFPMIVTEELSDWLIATSMSVFLVAALADTWFSRFLRQRFMMELGRLSFGFYLLHLPVLFICVSLLWTRVPAWIVFVLSLSASLAFAQAFHRYLEIPAMACGRSVGSRVDQRQTFLRQAVCIDVAPATADQPAQSAAIS